MPLQHHKVDGNAGGEYGLAKNKENEIINQGNNEICFLRKALVLFVSIQVNAFQCKGGKGTRER